MHLHYFLQSTSIDLQMNKIIPEDSDELFDSTPDSGEEFVPYTENSSSDCSAIIEVLPSSQCSVLHDFFHSKSRFT